MKETGEATVYRRRLRPSTQPGTAIGMPIEKRERIESPFSGMKRFKFMPWMVDKPRTPTFRFHPAPDEISMPFLSGSLSFERFRVAQFQAHSFEQEHLDLMAKYAAGQSETASADNVHTGFLGGAHLFDQDFDLGKNVISDAVHFGIRIDTNQVPAAIKNAWLQIELAGLRKDNPGGGITKAQKKEAKEAVEQRCEAEAATGKYRKLRPFSLLWDVPHEMLYFGGSAGATSSLCADLLELVFGIELRHVSAGTVAQSWAAQTDQFAKVDDLMPESFVEAHRHGSVAWANEHSKAPDFLGNEFLLWLWWYLETQSDCLTIRDDVEVTAMLTRTLSLECPLGESGKETITAESPVKLPEAMQAIEHGKLPRKTGMTLIRDGQQFDLTLQAETFGISGAKIRLEEDEQFDDNDRIDAVRTLCDTIDGMFETFCARRVEQEWQADADAMRQWLAGPQKRSRKSAA